MSESGFLQTPRRDARDTSEFNLADFVGLKIRVAGPEDVLRWSKGEVLKPETINYRTQKPERDGLFDERIFGPVKDWECYCGKYKRIRYKGVVCDKCGVEVTRSSVRRERMGHIDLAAPVTHIWYVRGVPYVLSTLLDVSVADLEKVIYFAAFIVTSVDETLRGEALAQLEEEYKKGKESLKTSPERLERLESTYKATKAFITDLQPKTVIAEGRYQELSLRFGNMVKVGIGAEAILDLLRQINLDNEIEQIRTSSKAAQPNTYRRLMKRLRLLVDMKQAGVKPEWLVITKLPVLPPDLRPMVQLDGGRFASSDLNDLYRRVLNRNNRLKRLLNQGAPDVITRNEKRMLQEAVDALIDNAARKTQGTSGRQPKSLSDMLRGKQGRFRQNLLGKRVDYSGRSVIVVGPELRLDQCGLPKIMALELFKPFVIAELIKGEYVHNVKNASRLIERGTPEVWEILEKITKDAYVLLNRAPTLHRLGIQAFRPVLIEGKAIQLHPLVCTAFNADFDGDQMAVHVPLSEPAKKEASTIMPSNRNLLKPASGEPVVTPRLDMVLGLFYLTTQTAGVLGEGKLFSSIDEVKTYYQLGKVHPQAKIILRHNGERIETTVGRALLNDILPSDHPFVNETLDSKRCRGLVSSLYKTYGQETTAVVVDQLMQLGFRFAERSSVTMAISDIITPKLKDSEIKEGEKNIEEINKRFRRGLITDMERRKLAIESWVEIRARIEKAVKESMPEGNPIWSMVTSGARGSSNQMTQLAGMIGLVVNPTGEIIDVPITSNYKEGLNVLEYFISTHGSRKGKSDTSLKTADAGYLTRRLVDVAQDVVISMPDCKTKESLLVKKADSADYGETYEERLLGRICAATIKKGQKQLIAAGEEITEEVVTALSEAGIEEVAVRSPLTCQAPWGICQKCYGRDLGTGKLVERGVAVGIIAAQAIGEPGTQLTMKTFHMGGVSVGDITSGLPRVEEIFEARPPHYAAVVSEIDGKAIIYEDKDKTYIEVISDEVPKESYQLEEGYQFAVEDKAIVKPKQAIATAPDRKAIRSTIVGRVEIYKDTITIVSLEPLSARYEVPANLSPIVENGDRVKRGQMLTEGYLNLNLSLELLGVRETENYIIKQVQSIYASHGATVNEKHIEIIARAMLSRVRVLDGGDSSLLAGQIVDRFAVELLNDQLAKEKKQPVKYEPLILGITRASLSTNSFLAAASFQETTSVLIKAAVQGAYDPLRGLKENVIIGKLIPAGTGFNQSSIAKLLAQKQSLSLN